MRCEIFSITIEHLLSEFLVGNIPAFLNARTENSTKQALEKISPTESRQNSRKYARFPDASLRLGFSLSFNYSKIIMTVTCAFFEFPLQFYLLYKHIPWYSYLSHTDSQHTSICIECQVFFIFRMEFAFRRTCDGSNYVSELNSFPKNFSLRTIVYMVKLYREISKPSYDTAKRIPPLLFLPSFVHKRVIRRSIIVSYHFIQ